MCGIFIVKTERNTNKYIYKFKSSLNDIYLRGPDKKQFIKKQNYLIGFTRLSINDLEEANQPYESEDKRFTLLFNGEILNYKSLLNYLSTKQIFLKRYTETEVILKLYILHKEKFLNYLKGFFSIVIIDHKIDKIFACVDHFSIKPLYYYHSKDLIIFSSNPSPILNNQFIKKDYDHLELINYVSLGRELNNKTIFKKINKLNASTYAIFYKNKVNIHKYWALFNKYKENYFSKKNCMNIISNKFDNVVNLWKTSDVKLAHTRSSGVDSNILNLYFKKNNIKTKNFLIKENKSQILDKNEINIKFDNTNLEKELDKYLKNNLDPISVGVSSNLTLFNLYKNISNKKFKVCFNGEGADEIFGGYSRYLKHLDLIIKENGDVYKSFLNLYQKEINHTNYSLNIDNFNIKDHLLNQIKKIKLNSKLNLNKILEFDQITWVPTLMKSHDSIGMFYSLEVRPPFLDTELVNTVNSIPANLKIHKNKQKIITHDILSKIFRFKVDRTKVGTPSFFYSIINKKRNKDILKEKIFYGKLSKYFNPKKTWEICNRQFKEKNDHIFLWRIFILSKILEQD